MKNFVRPGNVISMVAPAGGSVSGQGILLGTHLFGVAEDTIDAGALFSFRMEGEVTLPKTSALAIAIGDLVYWNNAAKMVNKTATGNKLVGIATSDAANPSPTVNVKLIPNGIPVA